LWPYFTVKPRDTLHSSNYEYTDSLAGARGHNMFMTFLKYY